MVNNLNLPPKRKKLKSKLHTRLILPMLLIALLQVAVFFIIMIVGGEFHYIEQYAYHTLEEKTENRRNYIAAELQQKIPYVQEYSEKINTLVTEILAEQQASISDLQTNKELNSLITKSSVETVVELLRRSMVNDVYLILETGDLYSDTNSTAKSALYLRDLDTKTDAGYEDLLMEIGSISISQDSGIMLDSGWSLYFEPDPEDTTNYDFYYRTLKHAQENSALGAEALGYWSSFSKLTRGGTASLKYTIPLIAEDGTVYGVLGIGLTEQNILSNLPANDFTNETACYVLGHDETDDVFDIVAHSGTAFAYLVGNVDTLPVSDMLAENIYDFSLSTDAELAGSVQYISLYDTDSPYYTERWALISVADRASVLQPLIFLIKMLLISVLVSLAASIVVMIVSCHQIVKPIVGAIGVMNADRKYNQILHFQPSNIIEIDRMTDAITQLQTNVQNYSSQVSQMIRIADVGLGTFMYDSTDDSVFVGQSLLSLLSSPLHQDEDVMLSREEFLDNIVEEKTKQMILEGLNQDFDNEKEDYTREYCINKKDGREVWIRLSIIYTTNKTCIGILQDITDTIEEKKRIEFERDHDSLTGLLNRRAYYQRIEKLFQDRRKLKNTAFIMLDLDNLKYVNDTYGHDFGDAYIKAAAEILKKFHNYGGIVARISGDEFNICLPGFSSKETVKGIIRDMRAELPKGGCLLSDGTNYKIRASMGVSWYPDDADSYELLIKYADFAMYTIKHSTKGGIAEFDINSYSADSLLLTGVEEMNRIIDECSVNYAFQSIVSTKTGTVYGYEALMRVQSDMFQSPLQLLRAAKSGAKLYEIERMTWTKSLRDFQTQIDEGHVAKDAHIFINSIANCELQAADQEAIMAEYSHLLPQIVLEIVESENADEDITTRKVEWVKNQHAQIALDDFGTGYNSEYALITIQPHIIKIDRSIISGCDHDARRRMIIGNLVRVAKAKHQQLLILAEGVETEGELKTVIECGVDLLQGFFLSRPMFEPAPLPVEMTEKIRGFANNKKKGR